MAHNLIEVDAFTTPIAVPDGADSRNNAAEVVQALAQALANRTNRLNIHAPFKDVDNVFTGHNTFDALTSILANIESAATDATLGAFVVRTTCDDDAHAGNKYKYVASFQVGGGGGVYVNIYSGTRASTADGEGQFLITINAVWDVAGQHFFKDSAGDAAFALIFNMATGALSWSIRNGPGNWTDWDVPGTATLTAGTGAFGQVLTVANVVSGADVISTANMHSGGMLDVTGSSSLHGGVVSGDDISIPSTKHLKYATAPSVFRRVRIAAGTTPQSEADVAFIGTKWLASSAYTISIPIAEFANQTELDALWVRYEASGDDGSIDLMRSDITDWLVTPGGATPSVTVLATASLLQAGSGVKSAIATLGTPEHMDHNRYDYWIRITGNASANHVIHAAALAMKPFSPGID